MNRMCGKLLPVALAAAMLSAGTQVHATQLPPAAPDVQLPVQEQAQEQAAASQAEEQPPRSRKLDILAKQIENPQTKGWLHVPGTKINYPILHNSLRIGNNYFTQHNFYGQEDKAGSFFADYRATFGHNGREDLARITTLYGHSYSDDPDGELMASIKRYRDEDFARTHPYIYFSTWSEDMVWEVFAVFDAHVNLPYVRHDLGPQDMARMLGAAMSSSLYNYGAKLTADDKMLVISTCTMNVEGHQNLDPYTTEYRFVVMARLVPQGAPLKTEAVFQVNENPVPPDSYIDFWDEEYIAEMIGYYESLQGANSGARQVDTGSASSSASSAAPSSSAPASAGTTGGTGARWSAP